MKSGLKMIEMWENAGEIGESRRKRMVSSGDVAK